MSVGRLTCKRGSAHLSATPGVPRGVARALVAVVVVLAALVGAARAQAASVRVDRRDARDGVHLTVVIAAGSGERNAVTVTAGSAEVVVHDDGATIVAQAGCAAQDGSTVRCGLLPQSSVVVEADLGDGDDGLVATGTPVQTRVDGGAGNDVLLGGDGPDRLLGGAGDDVLAGGASYDTLSGGDGADRLRGGDGPDTLIGDDGAAPGARDVLDGGAGEDTASYGGRRARMTVDLAAGVGGAAGERDVLAGVEDVDGGDGPDVLRGDDGPNRLDAGGASGARDVVEGRGGDDVLRGSGGADVLRGGAGRDRMGQGGPGTRILGDGGDDVLYGGRGIVVRGGAGDDVIGLPDVATRRRPGPFPAVDCGPGVDRVDPAVLGTRLRASCEEVARGTLRVGARPRVRGGAFVVRASCVALPSSGAPCTGSLTARVGGTVVARRALSVPDGGARTFRLPLRGRRARADVVRWTLRRDRTGVSDWTVAG